MTRFTQLAAMLMLTFASLQWMPAASAQDVIMTEHERTVWKLVNAERAKLNLPALVPHSRLMQAARYHATNMARQQTLNHILDGNDDAKRVEAHGYQWSNVGENIFAGDLKAPNMSHAFTVTAWMQSAGHKANILRAGNTETGIGFAIDKRGVLYAAQVFAKPKENAANQPLEGAMFQGILSTALPNIMDRNYEIYQIAMKKGQIMQLEYTAEYAPLLIVNNAQGQTVHNHVGGAAKNFLVPADGLYSIIVTSQEVKKGGTYRLKVKPVVAQ